MSSEYSPLSGGHFSFLPLAPIEMCVAPLLFFHLRDASLDVVRDLPLSDTDGRAPFPDENSLKRHDEPGSDGRHSIFFKFS